MDALSLGGLGAVALPDDRTLFRVWAPFVESLELVLLGKPAHVLPLVRDEQGYHSALHEGIRSGTRYLFRFPDGALLPDPASRFQPEGVDGPSAVFAPEFPWEDYGWKGIPLSDYVVYELHIGTFTAEGTFDAAIAHLQQLRELGITAVELMPVAQFPGARNWGYDGVFPFAAQNTYGGPIGLKRFVNACHRTGLAVILDVVYNHLGPHGNVLSQFGPYFNSRYATPWGAAMNFDAAESDEVRAYFIQNARQWLSEFHIDALRLDAVHAMIDSSAYPFLAELTDVVRSESRALGRERYLIAESDLNDPRVLHPRLRGGYGMHAQWLDDYHHAIHTLLTGEQRGYYADFGELTHLAAVLRDNFAYTGNYSVYRRRRHGAPASELEANRFIVCSQNHDQVGNRMAGDRLSTSLPPAALRLAAAAVILGPFIPLLWMGEEYGETAPFPFFVEHSSPELIQAVREGRKREFADFAWAGEPPDPQALETFESAKLNRALSGQSPHRELLAYYRRLLEVRHELRLGQLEDRGDVSVYEDERVITLKRRAADGGQILLVLSFNNAGTAIALHTTAEGASIVMDSNDAEWGGSGTARALKTAEASVILEPWHALLLHTTRTRL